MRSVVLPLVAPSDPALDAPLAGLAAPLPDAEDRAAAAARWGARLWMAAVLVSVLFILIVAALVAPLRSLLSD
jgi:hypothetical protein